MIFCCRHTLAVSFVAYHYHCEHFDDMCTVSVSSTVWVVADPGPDLNNASTLLLSLEGCRDNLLLACGRKVAAFMYLTHDGNFGVL